MYEVNFKMTIECKYSIINFMNLIKNYKNKIIFVGMILIIFTITYTTLLITGLTPKQFQADITGQNIFQVVGTDYQTKMIDIDTNLIPQSISIPKIKVNSLIHIPPAVDINTLDLALQKGAVYYPGSGTLQSGNMFLFGHSTNWQVVNNQAYKTFNDLEKLVPGDEIFLSVNGKTYVYKIVTVNRASENDTIIDFKKGSRMITISTCDTFGRKQDRWVVEGVFDRII
jgi:LPXTG-site transpeptidase (sortase) family protein